jgi:hypothetical protein
MHGRMGERKHDLHGRRIVVRQTKTRLGNCGPQVEFFVFRVEFFVFGVEFFVFGVEFFVFGVEFFV